MPIGATEEGAKNIIRNHNYSISHTNDNNGVHYVCYKDNDNWSITKWFVTIGIKNGKVESVKWFLESDSYDEIITDKNAIFAYFQEDLKYRAKEYGGEYYYSNFNYFGQMVGVVMYYKASYYNGGFVRLTFYSNKTISNMVNEKKFDELISKAKDLYWTNQYDEAKKKYDEAFALLPNKKSMYQREYNVCKYGGETNAYNKLIYDAEELRKNKKYDEANKKYDEAFEIFPDKKHTYQNADDIKEFYTLIYDAGDLRKQKKYNEAKKKYDKAFEMFPDKKSIYQKEYDECVTGR